MSDRTRGDGLGRRKFLTLAGTATLLTACGGKGDGGGPVAGPKPAAVPAPTPTFAPPSRKLTGDLKILLWSHPVPGHDAWFDSFAKDWGAQTGVEVIVDHIDTSEIPARLAAEIQAKRGHDLVQHIVPLPQLEPSVIDLKDVAEEAVRRHGLQVPICVKSSQNPVTGKHYAFAPAWTPNPGHHWSALWSAAGLPNGPAGYDDLLAAGIRIKAANGARVGIGMSQELDSNLACRAVLWSYGASIQDAGGKVVVNSPQTVAAVEYMVTLFEATMSGEVFSWNPASNDQRLLVGQLSYIVDSVSSWRAAQDNDPQVAVDLGFLPALRGPTAALAAPHGVFNWMVPSYAKGVDAAKEFLLHYTANMFAATYHSKLHDLPGFDATVPSLDTWLDNDPFGARPVTKLSILKNAADWSTNVGHPGPMNAAEAEVFASYVIPNMFAKAARGELEPDAAVAAAEKQIKPIFDKWRIKGLVGG